MEEVSWKKISSLSREASRQAEEIGKEWAGAVGVAWKRTTAFSKMAPTISQIAQEENAYRIIGVALLSLAADGLSTGERKKVGAKHW